MTQQITQISNTTLTLFLEIQAGPEMDGGPTNGTAPAHGMETFSTSPTTK